MPLILADLPPELVVRLVEEHLHNEAEFWLPYGLPSVSADEPSFEPDFKSTLVWRGPTWVNTNWFLVKALRRHGYPELAEELSRRTLAMVDRGGFRECFNPFTAEGYGARGFGWSTLVLDLHR
jgi:glycogen debranching enzyme